MEISEMHNKFRLYAQKMSMQTVLAILPEEIDEVFNTTIPEYARDKFSRKRNRELNGVSDNVIRLAELEPLYYNYKEGFTPAKNPDVIAFGEGFKFPLPIDYMFYLNTTVKITNGNSLSFADTRLIDIEKVPLTMNDYHSKSTSESPICYINNENVEVLLNEQISGIIFNYIRVPNKVSLANGVGCELPDFAVDEIIMRAVNLYNAASDNSSYEKVAIETQKLE